MSCGGRVVETCPSDMKAIYVRGVFWVLQGTLAIRSRNMAIKSQDLDLYYYIIHMFEGHFVAQRCEESKIRRYEWG